MSGPTAWHSIATTGYDVVEMRMGYEVGITTHLVARHKGAQIQIAETEVRDDRTLAQGSTPQVLLTLPATTPEAALEALDHGIKAVPKLGYSHNRQELETLLRTWLPASPA